jgi:hypothetical protein
MPSWGSISWATQYSGRACRLACGERLMIAAPMGPKYPRKLARSNWYAVKTEEVS